MKPQAKDLANAALFRIVGATTVLGVLLAAIIAVSNGDWARPGSWLLQSTAIIGAGLLLASMAAVMAKRFGRPGKAGFHAHVGLAGIGLVLVMAHWGFSIWQFPTLLLLLLIASMALGTWSRRSGAELMADTFGRKHAAFTAIDPVHKDQLRAIIVAKREALAEIDSRANEGTFSLQPRHWLRSPLQSLSYMRECRAERSLVGADRTLSPAHRYWRLAHRLLSWLFVVGLFGHIIIVTFFAGYVAEGREIYWWRVADWSF